MYTRTLCGIINVTKRGGTKMVRVDFGLHYSDVFESEQIALKELAEFITEQYEDLAYEENLLDSNKLTVKEMFKELGWEFEEVK